MPSCTPDDYDPLQLAQRTTFTSDGPGRTTRFRHASGHWLSADVMLRSIDDERLGSAALTIRPDETVVSRESTLRRQLVVEEYCNRLSAKLMMLVESDEVNRSIGESVEEICRLTGAHTGGVYLERSGGDLLDRVIGWIHPDYADTSTASLQTVDLRDQPGTAERWLTRNFVVGDVDLPEYDDLRKVPVADDLRAIISVPFVSGGIRGFFAVTRRDSPTTWRFVDAQLLRAVGAIYGAALYRSRVDQLWQLSYEEGPIGFSIRTTDGEMIQCNDRYLELYGFTREKAMTGNIFDLLPAAEARSLTEAIGEFSAWGDEAFTHVVRIADGDGATRWLRIHTSEIAFPQQPEPIRLSSVIDVTHEYPAELEAC